MSLLLGYSRVISHEAYFLFLPEDLYQPDTFYSFHSEELTLAPEDLNVGKINPRVEGVAALCLFIQNAFPATMPREGPTHRPNLYVSIYCLRSSFTK